MSAAAIHLTAPTPFVPQADQDVRRLPASYTNQRFVFTHYPAGWSFSLTLGFLPDLNTIVAKKGVNGVGEDGRMNKPIAGSIQKGGIVINPADGRLGKWRDYVASYDTVNGKHWCFKACRFTILPGGRVHQNDNAAEFAEFRRHLLDVGMCHALEESVYNELREVERKRLERLGKEAAKNPHMKAAYEERIEYGRAMEAAWRLYTGADQVIPEGAPQLTPTPTDAALGADEMAALTPPTIAGKRAIKVTS